MCSCFFLSHLEPIEPDGLSLRRPVSTHACLCRNLYLSLYFSISLSLSWMNIISLFLASSVCLSACLSARVYHSNFSMFPVACTTAGGIKCPLLPRRNDHLCLRQQDSAPETYWYPSSAYPVPHLPHPLRHSRHVWPKWLKRASNDFAQGAGNTTQGVIASDPPDFFLVEAGPLPSPKLLHSQGWSTMGPATRADQHKQNRARVKNKHERKQGKSNKEFKK